jgi:hypothetical protein
MLDIFASDVKRFLPLEFALRALIFFEDSVKQGSNAPSGDVFVEPFRPPMTTATQQDTHQAGYAQVVELEKKEEERVRSSLTTIAEEEQKAQNDFTDQMRHAEMKAKAEANDELKEYKDKELARILKEGEEHAESALKEIEANHKKHAPDIVKSLVSAVLEPSFLTR